MTAFMAAGGTGCRSAPSGPIQSAASVAQIQKLTPQQVSAGVQAHLRGVVTYASANEDVCFVQDATGGIRIQLRQGQMVADVGKEMDIWGTVVSAGEAPSLTSSRMDLLSDARLPDAEALDPPAGKPDHRLYRRVSVTGVVQSVMDAHSDVTVLRIRTGNAVVRVKALSPSFSDSESLVDAEIRIKGVLVTAPRTGDADGTLVWAPALADAVTLKPASPPGASPPITIAALRGLKEQQLPAHRVRVRGRFEAAGPTGRWFADGGGRMRVLVGPAGLPQSGGTQEVAGFATMRDGDVVLENAVAAASAAVGGKLPVLDTARAIHMLSASEASRKYPVRLRAVVTYSSSFNGNLFVQDHTDGMYVSLDDTEGSVLQPGDWIEVTGTTTPGQFAPSVKSGHFRILGRASLPAPDRNEIEAVFQGQRDCRWIELPGVIQSLTAGARDAMAQVLCGTHRLRAFIHGPTGELAALVNAEVKLRGVTGALYNNRRQMLGVVLYVPGREYIQVEQPAPADPFDLPLRTAQTLLQYQSGAAMGHRVRLRGTVTAAELSGPTVVRDATGPVIVKDHSEARLKPGDVAEVVGFPIAGSYSPLLTGATIRKVGCGKVPVPRTLGAAQLLDGSYDGELVQVEGLLNDRIMRADRLEFLLRSGHTQFTAVLRARTVPNIPKEGAQLRVAGIYSLQVDDSRVGVEPRSFEIRMRSPADLTILKQPPWLTFEHLLPIFLIAVTIAGVALLWASRLRRRLNAQTGSLVQKTAQLEKEHQQTTRALCRAREAEVMEQAHKHVLELVARDEDLDSVLTRLAQAVEERCMGVSCSIQLRLPGGRRVSASPSLARGWRHALANIEIEDFCGEGVHPLSSLARAPAWQAIADPRTADRIQRVCLAPIERESRVIGAVIAFLAGELALRRSERDFLISASKLAALAVERRALYDQLSYQALHDELTGLENRAAILARLSREIHTAAATRSLLGVIFIDLDNFKGTNDRLGHAAGDEVLREVARRMTAGVRRSDAIARLGGDEFVVVLPGIEQRVNACRIAAQLVASLSRPITFGGQTLSAGASSGVSLYPEDGEDAESLLRAADTRMYEEKTSQRRNSGAEIADRLDAETPVAR